VSALFLLVTATFGQVIHHSGLLRSQSAPAIDAGVKNIYIFNVHDFSAADDWQLT
jgi:hypothetical protein